MARIDTLANFLTDVATAIKNKTGKTEETITPANFDTEIESIEASGGVFAPDALSFSNYPGTTFDSTGLDTSKLTTMMNFFYLSNKLVTIDLHTFNTSNVTTMERMFYQCEKAQYINVSSFDTSNVRSMYNMFYNCITLPNLDVSNFNTASVTTMGYMFSWCAALTSLDLSNFETTLVTNMAGMFSYCSKLKYLDIRKFDFTNVTSYTGMFTNVPADCEIIVADDIARDWILAARDDLTNIKTVAELEAA